MNDSTEKGKITVAIPTVNRRDLVPLTVQSALSQTYGNIEILISNNASTDDTDLVLQKFQDPRIRIFKQDSRLGMVANWNFCLSKAIGEWFIVLSDDDLLRPTALEQLLKPLISGQASMSYSPFVTIDGFGREGWRSRPGPTLSSGAVFIKEHLSRKLMALPSGVLGRTEFLRAFGGFPDIGTTSDLGLRLLMATAGSVACMQVPLLYYRVHGGNLSDQSTMVVKSYLAFESWALRRNELAPYHGAISTYVWRGVTGYGVRAALHGDSNGTLASMASLAAIKVPIWRKWTSYCAIWSVRTRPIRAIVTARDKYMSRS